MTSRPSPEHSFFLPPLRQPVIRFDKGCRELEAAAARRDQKPRPVAAVFFLGGAAVNDGNTPQRWLRRAAPGRSQPSSREGVRENRRQIV
jgi:hypothetical protein